MKKKELLIVKAHTLVNQDTLNDIHQQLLKQLKTGIIVIDNKCDIECIEYDCKRIELKVIRKDEDIIAVE